MSSTDYKKPRKLDFPQCAKDALIRIGKCYIVVKQSQFHSFRSFLITESLSTSNKNQERCLELIAEQIFLEKKLEGKKSTNVGLTVFQEFQLVLVFAQYFSRPGPDVTRNAMFLCLFGHSSLSPSRSRVLSKFISTAVSDSIAPVTNHDPFRFFVVCFNDFVRLFLRLDSVCSRNMDATSWTERIG